MPRRAFHTSSKPPLTHFLCLPLLTPSSTPQLASSFSYFIAQFAPDPDSPASIKHGSLRPSPQSPLPQGSIRPLGTLHLTLGVMSLQSQEKLDHACNVLQELDLACLLKEAKPTISHTADQNGRITGSTVAPLSVYLSGLHAFPSASRATVLHVSPVDPTSRLMPFCLALRDHFVKAGILLPDPDRPLILHATIVNTIYANKDWRSEGGKRKGKITFDATEMMRRFNERAGLATEAVDGGNGGGGVALQTPAKSGPYIWAQELEIDKVKICEMGAKHLTKEEEFERGKAFVESGGSKERILLGQEYRIVAEKSICDGQYDAGAF